MFRDSRGHELHLGIVARNDDNKSLIDPKTILLANMGMEEEEEEEG